MRKIMRIFWAILNICVAILFGAIFLSLPKIKKENGKIKFGLISNQGKKHPIIGHLSCLWGKWIISLGAGIKVKVIGLEKLDKNKRYVFPVTHKSLIDVAVVMQALKNHSLVTMVKKSLAFVPVFGYALWRSKVLFVDRKREEKRRGLVERMAENIRKANLSAFIFIEGKRIEEKGLGRFKTGPVRVAVQAGLPLVPVVLINTDKVVPLIRDKRKPYLLRLLKSLSLFDNSQIVKVVIGDPIDVGHISLDDREEIRRFTDRLREEMIETIEKYS